MDACAPSRPGACILLLLLVSVGRAWWTLLAPRASVGHGGGGLVVCTHPVAAGARQFARSRAERRATLGRLTTLATAWAVKLPACSPSPVSAARSWIRRPAHSGQWPLAG